MADDGRRRPTGTENEGAAASRRRRRRGGGAAAELAALSRARPGKQFPRVVRKQPNQSCILTGVVKQTGHELPPLEGFTNALPRAILCLAIGLSGRVSGPSERLSPSHGRIEAPRCRRRRSANQGADAATRRIGPMPTSLIHVRWI